MKHLRKYVPFFLLALALVISITLLTPKPAATTESGLTFVLNSDESSYTLSGGEAPANGELIIPSTYQGKPVTAIAAWSFDFCTDLISVTIPDSVTTIGEYAFAQCAGLQSITIPNSITSIGEYALFSCPQLQSVTIPNSVTSIGTNALSRCSSLTGIWVDPQNTIYCSDDKGVLFDKNKTTVLQAPNAMEGTYIIPDSVTSISRIAFLSCSKLQSITIPDSVTFIGDSAFNSCSSLQSIIIPNSITSIDYRVFYNCFNLKSITIPAGVTSIGDSAFYGCNKLQDVYYGGTQAKWAGVTIGESNDYLLRATLHCASAPQVQIGDINEDGTVSNDDVVLLLWHTLFPEDYPLTVSGDINQNGSVSNDDVVLLLWHTLFPEDYPL